MPFDSRFIALRTLVVGDFRMPTAATLAQSAADLELRFPAALRAPALQNHGIPPADEALVTVMAELFRKQFPNRPRPQLFDWACTYFAAVRQASPPPAPALFLAAVTPESASVPRMDVPWEKRPRSKAKAPSSRSRAPAEKKAKAASRKKKR